MTRGRSTLLASAIALSLGGCFVDRSGLGTDDRDGGPVAVDASEQTDGEVSAPDGGPSGDAGGAEDAGSAPDGGTDGGVVEPADGGTGPLRIVEVAAGATHSLARRSDGVVFCWGHNADGQCGAPAADRTAPVRVDLGGRAVAIAAGDDFSCAIVSDGTSRRLVCWGDNDNLQIGDTADPQPVPQHVFAGAASAAAGGDHGCLISGGAIRCWGDNDNLQLGVSGGDRGVVTSLGFPTGGADARMLALGSDHSCALLDTGPVFCWGINDVGQVGISPGDDVGTPTLVDLPDAQSIGAGANHTCAIHGGALSCWGAGGDGQLGDGSGSSSSDPVAVAITAPSEVGGGLAHTCARTGSGEVWCWGDDARGQIGGAGDSDDPVRVGGLGVADELAVGGEHACAVVAGEVWCWGRNNKDQLGGAGGDTGTPRQVPGLLTAVSP